MGGFPVASPAAALALVAAVDPDGYARRRNHLDGPVSGLSPYLTHGVTDIPRVVAALCARAPLATQHKFVYELGWREYFRHVWMHRGAGIFRSLHPGPLSEADYAAALPADLRAARTGLAPIDAAVRSLYERGTLHNHARMWLASYLVHLRKVHWRAGADWMYGHLLDGDLASNHLSWQWVAGTGSHKPYLFNAANVARFAPAGWHCGGGPLDVGYEALERIARDPAARLGIPSAGAAADPPVPGVVEPPVLGGPPAWLGAVAPDAAAVAGREVWLVHPWSLGELPSDLPGDVLPIGLWVADFHRAWPWREARWRFVGERMGALARVCWWGEAAAIGRALAAARRVRVLDEPHLSPWLAEWAECRQAPRLFPRLERRCDSFSQWWTRVTRGRPQAAGLLVGAIDGGAA